MNGTLVQDGQATKSKSADKKEAKRAEKASKLAAKQKMIEQMEKKGKEKKESEAVKPADKEDEEEIWTRSIAPGQYKDVNSRPMALGYNPKAVEANWYSWWEKERFYSPDAGNSKGKEVYVIPAPPPNVTGTLHIGHALTIAIQDALIRWNRMKGKLVLFHPGFDHAGIATQSVVEKRLFAQEKKTRHDLGREAFVERVFDWTVDYRARISKQLKSLGSSYDWERSRYTMEPMLSDAVKEAFVRLHQDGTIYRANRLVNWCTQLNTTLSNLEVDQKELTGRTLLPVPGYPGERVEFGVIISFKYPIEGTEDDHIIVATTRIETMMGDTAIAVHSQDERYKRFHGKFAIHPFNKRRIPIITDDIAVDMEFGTGAVKITPAHDKNDYEVGKRHGLEFINILNDDGTLNEHGGAEFKGMKRYHVRRQIIERLKELNLYVETQDKALKLPVCSRSGDVIEEVMKPQWWVNCRKLAGPAIEAVKSGQLSIQPKQSEDDWYRWLENTQDWCISRQLWWGHRIPAYFVKFDDHDQSQLIQDRSNSDYFVSGRTLEEAKAWADKLAKGKKYTLEQDQDVLDTWFSSGLWPFSIQGWPNETQDLKAFYPASLLETGWDILFFWVARMVMLGIKLTGQVPFNQVFCHPIIRDAYGRKMSKSLGNVIDPVDVIQGASLQALHDQLRMGNLDEKEIAKAEQGQKKTYPKGIPQCGADALRFSLCSYTTSGARDINLDVLRIEGYRKFGNKLWNATRFALMKLGTDFTSLPTNELPGRSLVERWLLHRLNETVKTANEAFANFNMFTATSSIHQFWLYDLCDVYIEYIKPITESEIPTKKTSALNTLHKSLDEGLKLLHPFMPYLTEELWQRLPRPAWETSRTISLSSYPTFDHSLVDPQAATDFEFAFEIIKTIRSLAAEYGLTSNLQPFILTTDERTHVLLSNELSGMSTLIKGCHTIQLVRSTEALPKGCASQLINPETTVHLLVKGFVDIQVEVNKLEKKREKVLLQFESLQKDRKKPEYEQKTPKDIQEAEEEKVRRPITPWHGS